MVRSLPIFMISALGACGSDDIEHKYVDEGRLCFGAPGTDTFSATTPMQLAADQAVEIAVIVDQCLSSSCDVDRAFVCSAEVEGSQITVTSSLRWRNHGRECTDDCGRPLARCRTPVLAAGTYTVKLGDQTTPLQLPGVAEPCAF